MGFVGEIECFVFNKLNRLGVLFELNKLKYI
jgi:hypothetical protein